MDTPSLKELEWRPCSVRRPPKRCTDDIRRAAESRWEPLEASGPGLCIVELPTEDLYPAEDINWLKGL
ncbi:jg8314 [Pararge aegeria aegeria]|uniref:Jg8314 protein n=1 Tax=Pararge aegeria aegeria TaxID=348720 RepID=A0A8S4SLQ2_9NEOP|nr:jg8314 [Pararge aegeria aegeria]